MRYRVIVTQDVTMSGTVIVEADNEEDAEENALEKFYSRDLQMDLDDSMGQPYVTLVEEVNEASSNPRGEG